MAHWHAKEAGASHHRLPQAAMEIAGRTSFDGNLLSDGFGWEPDMGRRIYPMPAWFNFMCTAVFVSTCVDDAAHAHRRHCHAMPLCEDRWLHAWHLHIPSAFSTAVLDVGSDVSREASSFLEHLSRSSTGCYPLRMDIRVSLHDWTKHAAADGWNCHSLAPEPW